MTDLTDKWKKGEFIICNAGKCQYYYVQNEEQREVIKTEYCLFDDNTPNWQILAPVPSYEEWQAKLEENAQLKELLKECELWFTGIVGNMNDKNVGEHNRNLPIGNFEYAFKVFSQKINEVLK